MPRKKLVVSFLTYKQFAKKYNIPLSVGGKLKTMKQLADDIRNYEKMQKPKGQTLY